MAPNDAIWKPNVTVAAVVERDGKFLLVEEETERGPQFNQPAGHLEPGEALLDAVIRETLEESAFHFTPRMLIGVYQYRHHSKEITYMRFAFGGDITGHEKDRALDSGILRAVWMNPAEIRTCGDRHRTPLVIRCIDDYLAGKHYPLEIITYYA